MGKPALKEEYIRQEFDKRGFIIDDEYISGHRKIKTFCHCGKVFYPISNNVINNATKSCGHCNDPNVGEKYYSWTIVDTKPAKSIGCNVKVVCDCGKDGGWYKSNIIITGHTKSCGHCEDLKIGDVYGKITIVKTIPSISGGCDIIGLCECGRNTDRIHGYKLKSGNTKTCGCCNNPKIGDKFNLLTVIDVLPSKTRGCEIICMCDCGNITKPIRALRIYTGHIKTCGNCNLRHNGRFTSAIAIKLHSIVEEILQKPCKHNHDIKDVGCVDIFQPELQLVIEYDGYYNHVVRNGNRLQKDKEKYHKIIQLGYKFLNIKSGGYDLPPEQQLKKILLHDFQNGVKKRTITMKSWKKFPKCS